MHYLIGLHASELVLFGEILDRIGCKIDYGQVFFIHLMLFTKILKTKYIVVFHKLSPLYTDVIKCSITWSTATAGRARDLPPARDASGRSARGHPG